ncbi:MAG TPA: hypothetical protein VIX90_11030 [Edaphobacter sp.]
MALRAQQPDITIPPTFSLHIRDTHPVASPPISFSFTQCDGRGNVYFDLTGTSLFGGNILRVSGDGQEVRPISLPTSLGKYGEWHYSVDQDGGLYAIFSEAENHVLVHLSLSGEEMYRTTLSLPLYFHVYSFAVLPDGRSMFFGSLPSRETSASNEIPFSIWLDAGGRLVRKTPPEKQFSPSTDRPDGLVAAGRPGTFIEATTSEIRVFAADGNLLQTFPIIQPTKDSFVSSLQLVDGLIAIAFQHPANTGSTEAEGTSKSESSPAPYSVLLEQIWLVANPVSGELKAFYNKPKDFVGSTVCYLGHREFLYMTVKDRRLWFMEASE